MTNGLKDCMDSFIPIYWICGRLFYRHLDFWQTPGRFWPLIHL